MFVIIDTKTGRPLTLDLEVEVVNEGMPDESYPVAHARMVVSDIEGGALFCVGDEAVARELVVVGKVDCGMFYHLATRLDRATLVPTRLRVA